MSDPIHNNTAAMFGVQNPAALAEDDQRRAIRKAAREMFIGAENFGTNSLRHPTGQLSGVLDEGLTALSKAEAARLAKPTPAPVKKTSAPDQRRGGFGFSDAYTLRNRGNPFLKF